MMTSSPTTVNSTTITTVTAHEKTPMMTSSPTPGYDHMLESNATKKSNNVTRGNATPNFQIINGSGFLHNITIYTCGLVAVNSTTITTTPMMTSSPTTVNSPTITTTVTAHEKTPLMTSSPTPETG
ncbi:mucin-17 [Fundulus heteroclitus]|uniref:mucin-17 n=1 Tax=Fundulus heteroclitus TaxID=8078 RepID=UPI00165A373E|nr:mucin-17 [Fundulus heteroclitus]